MAVTNTALGNLHFVIKGDYDSGTSYIVDDVVTYRNSDYLCIADTTVGILPTDASYFTPIANGFKSRGLFDQTLGTAYYKNDIVEVEVPLETQSGNAIPTVLSSKAFYVCLADVTTTGAITDQPWHNNANWHKLSAEFNYDDSVITADEAKQTDLYTGDPTECVWLPNWEDGIVGGDSTPQWGTLLGGISHCRQGVNVETFIDGIGGIRAWGNNHSGLNYGNMGTATSLVFPFLDWYRSTDNGGAGVHTTPDGNMPKAVQVINCYNRGMALFNNGEVYSWGYAGHGQNGIRDTSTRNYPVRVGGTYQEVYLATNTTTHVWRDLKIKKIYMSGQEGGYDNSSVSCFALDENGDLWAWGYNGYGQLGQGNTTNLNIPTIIDRVTYFNNNDIVAFWTAGAQYAHCHAVDSAGNLYSWGYNSYGALGLGDTTNRSTPVQVTNPIFNTANEGNIVKLLSDNYASYGRAAILTDKGRVFTTGYNGYGWAMAGNTNQQNIWTQVTLGPGSGTSATATNMWFVGNGQYGSFWVYDEAAEEMYTCGRNNYYQLSNGSSTDTSSPGVAQWDINGQLSNIQNVKAVMSWSQGDVHNVVVLTKQGFFFTGGQCSYGALSNGQSVGQLSTWESSPNAIENRNNGHICMPRTMTDVQGNVDQIMPHGYSTSAYVCLDVKTRDGRFVRSGYNGSQMSGHYEQYRNSGTGTYGEHIGTPPAIGS
jgi:alpha-tubulin suppressor-like RCC1 family protein